MSYYLTDGTSEPTMVSSNQGWYDFTDWLEEQGTEPLTQEFIENGEADSPSDLLSELDGLDDPEDDDVATVFNSLLDFLRTEPDKVILSDGMVEDTEDDLTDNFNPNQPRDNEGKFSTGGGAVDFGAKLTDKFSQGLAGNKVTDKMVEDVKNKLQEEGRLNPDGTLSLYHETLEDTDTVDSILKHGLVPGAQPAPGQTWTAAESQLATYFHQSKEAVQAWDNPEMGATVIEARVPITKGLLSRLLPDEDNGSARKDGIKDLVNGNGAIAIVGGVPAKYLKHSKASTPSGFTFEKGKGLIRIRDANGHIIHRFIGDEAGARAWLKSYTD